LHLLALYRSYNSAQDLLKLEFAIESYALSSEWTSVIFFFAHARVAREHKSLLLSTIRFKKQLKII